MILGGFTLGSDGCQPAGATSDPGGLLWQTGPADIRSFGASDGGRVTVLGCCGATDAELRSLSRRVLPEDVAWRWPGAYAVVEQRGPHTVVHTDPSGAVPLYATRYEAGWAWSSSARALADLTGAGVDPVRVAVAVFLPHVPAAVGPRTFFTGVQQLPPGTRIELAAGRDLRCATVWRPDPVPGPAHDRLRSTLEEAVRLRVAGDPDLTCDLSGGLDSSSLALLAATARPDVGTLHTVTVHPAGQTDGADLTYARLAAAHHPRLIHQLLPLGAEHLPYTDITTVPATDEPAPSTLTRARLEGQLHWMRDRLGSRTHLTGDGGDSVLFVPAAHLADLLRHRLHRRAAAEAAGWARLRHRPVLPLLREARTLARTSRAQALADQAAALEGGSAPAGQGDVRWFPAVPLPRWATSTAAGMLSDAVHNVAAAADPLPGLDLAARILVDEVREVARTAAADAQLAAASGIELHNPFLDGSVVDAVLRTEVWARPPVHTYKPVLVRAMSGVLPDALASRTTKGSFNADHYTGLRANLPELQHLADGRLAALGLADPALLRAHLAQAAAGIPMPLAPLEQALAAEAWLRTLDRPATPWLRPREGDRRG
ncbi:asparagine synthase (glutamine-hydrolysing) [Streptomyces sp. KhCrAH-43]|uniref:albusnodin/ikarugamycin family macrolactam cyclase n=1 Tax=unclassified Streptomyces TaxID=2593676 RepID=UPI00037F36B6|nr:albusnodin/ikarugamycin family macrolactam cyclase [Streptomyces sp. KhCrAH-43]MYS33583.1 albusnodin/ikarugamycin family macrolactam cyclase [Streptomyces sp. SID4920]MYX63824.1 albusnodin/ikarugamycin family macrolactam cyclase [Streptomyces sp. SID8373]RAJ52824.1 asparagine synthase (glutamine-hydrolysing) [Streptomyces sp. KhCrAH-43]